MKAKKENKKLTVDQQITRRNFISFATFIGAGAAAYGGWKWLYNSAIEPKTITGSARVPLRRALNKTELFFRNFFSNKNLVKTYPKSMAAKKVRVNSRIGMYDNNTFDVAAWKLEVKKPGDDSVFISLDELKALPKTEIVFAFKCVEGWDQISYWGGVKFSDFMAHYKLDSLAKLQYVGLETPDKNYYVGLDMDSAMHPQTLLAYEVNAKPLPPEHGAPLRLIIPVKYGIKNLKRIGSISFNNNRPRDYWAEKGYDYYSGL